VYKYLQFYNAIGFRPIYTKCYIILVIYNYICSFIPVYRPVYGYTGLYKFIQVCRPVSGTKGGQRPVVISVHTHCGENFVTTYIGLYIIYYIGLVTFLNVIIKAKDDLKKTAFTHSEVKLVAHYVLGNILFINDLSNITVNGVFTKLCADDLKR